MNEFERRFLEVVQNDLDLKEAVRALGSNAVVEYFGYSVALGSIANPLTVGTTFTGIITTRADAWFVIEYCHAGVVLPAGSTFGDLSQIVPMSNASLQITDTSNGHELFQAALPGMLVAGSPLSGGAGIPYVYPTPRLVPPNTNIKIEVTQIATTALTNPIPVGAFVMLNGARVALV